MIYELHVGAFTEAGTFRSAAARLDELVDLGVTAIELMPVADCAGRWNWGYDGVCLFAPNRNYGTPHDLKSLVNTALAKGLAVILDVVYNHLGPEGNYLGEAGPYLSSHHNMIWGIECRCFRIKSRRSATEYLSNAGHDPIPGPGTKVKVYLNSDGTDWTVLTPNGITPPDANTDQEVVRADVHLSAAT